MAIPDHTDRPIAALVSLEGRVAVVTGGAGGTGAGIVRRLAEAGATVVITDAVAHVAAAAVDEVEAAGGRGLALQLDVTDEAAVVTGVAEVVERLGRVDVWVNNAGAYPTAPVLEMSGDQWDEVLDFNLKGAFLCAREAARHMVAGGRPGVIVNIGSTASFRAYSSGAAHYVASKFGMRGLTQALATELGPQGIRVLHVAPTFTVTPGVRTRRADLDDDQFRAYVEAAGAAKPLGRVGVPDDVGRVVLFCASDLSGFMTGSTLAVDAGDLAR